MPSNPCDTIAKPVARTVFDNQTLALRLLELSPSNSIGNDILDSSGLLLVTFGELLIRQGETTLMVSSGKYIKLPVGAGTQLTTNYFVDLLWMQSKESNDAPSAESAGCHLPEGISRVVLNQMS